MELDLDNIQDYSPAVMEAYVEKQKHNTYVKRKDDKIDKVSDEFHVYLEKKAQYTIETREKKGLTTRKKKKSPIADIKDMDEFRAQSGEL